MIREIYACVKIYTYLACSIKHSHNNFLLSSYHFIKFYAVYELCVYVYVNVYVYVYMCTAVICKILYIFHIFYISIIIINFFQ